jgi:hypothetical protein
MTTRREPNLDACRRLAFGFGYDLQECGAFLGTPNFKIAEELVKKLKRQSTPGSQKPLGLGIGQ